MHWLSRLLLLGMGHAMAELGLSDGDIFKIQRAFGPGALAQVKSNPYVLSRLFPLKVVDAIAQRLGARPNSVERAVAIVEYELDKALMDGHCYTHTHTLLQKARGECRLSTTTFTEAHLATVDTIVVEGKYALLRSIRDAEVFIGQRVSELLRAMTSVPPDVSTRQELDAIFELTKTQDRVRDLDQEQAIWFILHETIAVITGAPGTGKTYSLTAALDLLDARHISYALCAPTGKAARRMTEVTGRPASTIHRLLQWRPDGFVFNADNPLPWDVVVVDESSMIDIRLAADLMAAVNPQHTRIIFVGDANQLPPVGPGAFFSDLIASKKIPTIWLSHLHRAAAGSWIYRNAPKILAGAGVELDVDVPDFDWYEMRSDDPEGIKGVAADVISKLLEEGQSWDDFQLLTPMKIRDGGAYELNGAIRAALIKNEGVRAKVGAYESEAEVCRGDRVIQIKNDYELDIFNGECGQIALVETPSSVRVRFDNEYRNVKGARLKNLALSYALTCHKSQGSQWKTVIVVCHSVHGRMLNRRLFYTAVTRAQKKVILIGDENGVKQAIRSVHDVQRRTQLVSRITA